MIGDMYPVISPDGSKIAFVMKDEGGDSEIYVVDVVISGNVNQPPVASFTYLPESPAG